MKCFVPFLRPAAMVMGLAVSVPSVLADQHVAVVGTASPEYSRRKYDGARPRVETYVFMAGKYFDGVTVDRSIERMPFRQIAELLAPELARQQYLPTKDAKAADLLIVVHWGTTIPRVTADEMHGKNVISLDNQAEKDLHRQIVAAESGADSDGLAAWLSTGSEEDRKIGYEQGERITDGLDADLSRATNARLLGYTRELRQLQTAMLSSQTEATLLSDLAGERYFIILKAYDLHAQPEAGQPRRPVWTLHLNIRSPGHNFPTALDLMGTVAVDYFGRDTDGVKTARPTTREGKVNLAPLIILGEVK